MNQLTPEQIVVGFGIFLALWYLFAAIYNRRRGLGVYQWLRGGLDQVGGSLSGRWLGSSGSGAELTVRQANAPLKEIQLIYLLASRELLPLFLVDLLRGKHDRIIVRAALRNPIPGEVQVAPSGSSMARRLRKGVNETSIQDGPYGTVISAQGSEATKIVAALTPFLEKYGSRLVQLSWSKKSPHLIAVLDLAGLYEKGGSAEALYGDLVALAQLASRSA